MNKYTSAFSILLISSLLSNIQISVKVSVELQLFRVSMDPFQCSSINLLCIVSHILTSSVVPNRPFQLKYLKFLICVLLFKSNYAITKSIYVNSCEAGKVGQKYRT